MERFITFRNKYVHELISVKTQFVNDLHKGIEVINEVCVEVGSLYNGTDLKEKIRRIKDRLNRNLSTMPTTKKDEIECNIFLRSENLEKFSKLRDLKDNF